jgi:cobalt-zinc-cadmium efflux system protein
VHAHDSVKGIRLAFFMNLGFALLEIGGGIWTNSLAIVSDAVHDLGDSVALGLAWYLERYSRRGQDSRFTFGYRRFSLLGALISTIILIGGSFFILTEAIPRLFRPEPTNAQGMILFAVLGIAANGIAALRMRRDKALNSRVVMLHLLEDVLGWVAVLVVSVILLFVDIHILDPLLSIVVTLYVLYNVIKNVKETLSLFLQGAPAHVDVEALETLILSIEGVEAVHHTHVWSLDGEHHILSTHVVVDEETSRQQAQAIKEQIRTASDDVDCEHATIEIEYGPGQCRLAEMRH